MQFRCFTCHHKFHDGLPPMEALTDQQAALVGEPRTSVDDIRLILLQTQFSGMSPAQFCDDCLLAIVDNPRAFAEPAPAAHELLQGGGSVWCRCGVTYHTEGPGPDIWVNINRLRMRHISDTIN